MTTPLPYKQYEFEQFKADISISIKVVTDICNAINIAKNNDVFQNDKLIYIKLNGNIIGSFIK